ncbi:hypothetical protein [Streptomyces sp. NPDC005507]
MPLDQAGRLIGTRSVVPEPLHPAQISHLDVRRRNRFGGALHEYRHAA